MDAEGAHRSRLILRRSGRVILVNQADRVLLFSALETLPDEARRVIWVLPGGGAEDGESVVSAAARELHEETGLRVAPEELRGPVALSRGAWSFEGVDYWSEEAFFLLRISEWDVSTAGVSPLEREFVTGHRWRSVDELVSTDATIFPRDLAPLVSRLLAGDSPWQPVELPW